MVKELCPDLFCIQVPLPGSPLKYLNSYIIRDSDRSLIIDTGFNNDICLEAMEKGLDEIGVNVARADIFITHFHADHFSLMPRLRKPETKIYFNRPESELLENWEGFGTMLKNAEKHGFPSPSLEKALNAHPGSKFGVKWTPDAKMLSEGEKLSYGAYTFTCIETPGHTLGHLCLYEADKKILISGDHVLIDITPNIQCWRDEDNPLKDYMESLVKIRDLEVDLVLPGHRRNFTDLASRVDELLSHHEDRLDEILHILKDAASLTAFEIAARMTWDIRAENWEAFPIAQQWFATGEAISHLRYLENAGEIRRESENGVFLFNRFSREI